MRKRIGSAKKLGNIYEKTGHEVVWCDKCKLIKDIKTKKDEVGLHGPSLSYGMFCLCNSKIEEGI